MLGCSRAIQRFVRPLFVCLAIVWAAPESQGFWRDMHREMSPLSPLYHGTLHVVRGSFNLLWGPADIMSSGMKLSTNPLVGGIGVIEGLVKTWTAVPMVVFGTAQVAFGAGHLGCWFLGNHPACLVGVGSFSSVLAYQFYQHSQSVVLPNDIVVCAEQAHEAGRWIVSSMHAELPKLNSTFAHSLFQQCHANGTECLHNVLERTVVGVQGAIDVTARSLQRGGGCLVNTTYPAMQFVGYNWQMAGHILSVVHSLAVNPAAILDTLKKTVETFENVGGIPR